MNVYKVIEETDSHTLYEFRTIYIWILYSILAVMFAGMFSNLEILKQIALGLFLIYFITISLPMMKTHKKIRKAMLAGSIEMTGSKWSFKQPLKIKILKHNT